MNKNIIIMIVVCVMIFMVVRNTIETFDFYTPTVEIKNDLEQYNYFKIDESPLDNDSHLGENNFNLNYHIVNDCV